MAVPWYHSERLAGFAFQACSFNHSDISPFRINDLRAVWIDYRKTLLQILLFCNAICIQRFTDGADSIVMEIVSDLLMSFDHLRRWRTRGSVFSERRWNRSSRGAGWRCEGERAPDEGEAKVCRQLERPNGANGPVIRHR